MKNNIILLWAVLMPFSFAYAQTTEAEEALQAPITDTIEGWHTGGTITLNINQVSLTNWAAGGQNSVSASGLLHLFANLTREKSLWENTLDLGYGTVRQGTNQGWWKTDDVIDFSTKYGRKLSSNWYYAGMLNFRTQWARGYNYPNDSVVISEFMAPAYLLVALGFDYKPNQKFTAFLAPVTAKATFVQNQVLADEGAFGVEEAVYDSSGIRITPGKNARAEFGGYVRLQLKQDLMENVSLHTKLAVFSNYLQKPQNLDINWEVLLSMKVNKFISATLSTQLLYDDDVDIAVDTDDDGIPDKSGPRTQFKEVLGVGFSYTF